MSYGVIGVDYEQRVDFARLSKDRLEKSKKAPKNSRLGALDKAVALIKNTLAEYGLEKEPIGFDIVDAL